ncbi:hypothetical protein GT360_09205 [Vibrio astriarenae]|uniref:Uncharacterized protein n=1 Tax=Vibrio astriarenae TaxID=1481923 RepID=A0A7Z2T3G8_9VIBR|nr:hypothetical protein [Vibrio astriarenae]QIA63681.1 hypothetical protein GT360_09205 [Vibrio astriarenae]
MRKTVVAVALALISTQALANSDRERERAVMSNFSYDYLEARVGISPVTVGAQFSKSIHPNAHFVARIDTEMESDYDAAAGLGFHAPVSNWADVTGEMLFRIQDFDSTESGVEVNLGVRQWLGPQLEVGGKVGYVSIKSEEEVIGSLHARFHSTELFSLGAEFRINDSYGEQLMMTTRFKF